jgi:hypothetical protein
MSVKLKSYLILFICFFAVCASAQNKQSKEKKLIQFSGLVVTGNTDSLEPVPFASLMIKGTNKGAISSYSGFFSFVAQAGDIIEFSAMGYKSSNYKISDTLSMSRYSWIQFLASDTIYFSETVITPWPTIEQFKKTFVSTKIPDDDMARAKRNLDLAAMKEKAKNMSMDGSENYRSFVSQQVYNASYQGMYKPGLTNMTNNPLLNPFAWAQFIKAWKEGKFKQPDEDHDQNSGQ